MKFIVYDFDNRDATGPFDTYNEASDWCDDPVFGKTKYSAYGIYPLIEPEYAEGDIDGDVLTSVASNIFTGNQQQ
jgi:hypothetical protein